MNMKRAYFENGIVIESPNRATLKRISRYICRRDNVCVFFRWSNKAEITIMDYMKKYEDLPFL